MSIGGKHAWERALRETNSIGSGAKLTLYTLATWADGNGRNCFPSVARLAQCTGKTERTVQVHLREAEEAGWISRTPRPGRSTLYALTITAPEVTPAADLTPDDPAETPKADEDADDPGESTPEASFAPPPKSASPYQTKYQTTPRAKATRAAAAADVTLTDDGQTAPTLDDLDDGDEADPLNNDMDAWQAMTWLLHSVGADLTDRRLYRGVYERMLMVAPVNRPLVVRKARKWRNLRGVRDPLGCVLARVNEADGVARSVSAAA